MSQGDYFILMGIGGGFLVLGMVALFWGRQEEKNYFNHLATRSNDLREFMNHWPPRPQPGALKIGGWIALAVGLIMLAVGVVLWLVS